MDRTTALHLLKAHKPVLAKRFGVVRLALFGSTARDTVRPDSDVDVLVGFDGPATSERYFGVQFCSSIWKTCWAAASIWWRKRRCASGCALMSSGMPSPFEQDDGVRLEASRRSRPTLLHPSSRL